jgi:NADPH-dependent ferric siderophore reductase
MNQPPAQAPRRVRPKPRLVDVSSLEHLTPGCIRVVLSGPELEGFTTKGPAEHVKVLLPRPGESRPQLPEWGPEGPVLQDGQQMPPSRTYTPRAWDPASHRLTVDFMLHGEGLASNWARNARPGDVVAVSGQPGGAYQVDPGADWYLLGGDESALPALATILEALPSSARGKAFLEVTDPAEVQALSAPAQVEIEWLYRGQREGVAGMELDRAFRAFESPAGRGRVWVGCEAGVMRSIRRHLLEDRNMDRSDIHTHGYWKYGVANHPDHDVGQDA